jgi:CheY-like chemotaxis protein
VQYNILVVDDEPTYLEATKNILEPKGYVIHTATSGKEAIEKVSAAPKLYALVILDYRMPGKDGAETAQAV